MDKIQETARHDKPDSYPNTKAHKITLPTGEVALVDITDAYLVGQYRWHRGGTGNRYVAASTPKGEPPLYLHRLIKAPGPAELVDHIDGNPLNNRRSNLRIVTPSQNAANLTETKNQTGFRGVAMYGPRRFRAMLEHHGAVFRGPSRRTAKQAAQDFDMMARGIFGEFASFNFPRQGERGVRRMQ